jgi:hypothetical protein
VTYEPNPPPEQVEAFQPFGGKPLTMLKVGAGLLARKGKAEPILEPSPKKRAELEARVTKELLEAEGLQPAAKSPVEGSAEVAARAKPSVADAFEGWSGELAQSAPPTNAKAPKTDEGRTMKKAPAPTAAVSLELTAPEVLRLNVASMRLGMTVDDILSAAVGAFLDTHKVPSTDACARLLGDVAR